MWLGHRAESAVGEGTHSYSAAGLAGHGHTLSYRSQAKNSEGSVDISVALR